MSDRSGPVSDRKAAVSERLPPRAFASRVPDETGAAEVRRLLWSAAFFVVALGVYAALVRIGVFH